MGKILENSTSTSNQNVIKRKKIVAKGNKFLKRKSTQLGETTSKSQEKKEKKEIIFEEESSHTETHETKTFKSQVLHRQNMKKYDKPTQCDTCTMIFPTQTKAIQHKHKAHPNIPNSFCKFCGKLFVLKNSLEEHLTKDHSNQESQTHNFIKCDFCFATFSNNEALKYHVKSMHQQINYMLACDLYIPPPSTKIMRSNSNELFSAYYCHLCGVEYMVKYSLKKHLYEMHSPEERNAHPNDFVKCTKCEGKFFTKVAYEKHLKFHKPDDFYAANQEARLKVVSRVDQDFDISRVPLLQEINTMLKQMAQGTINTSPMGSTKTNLSGSLIKVEHDIINKGSVSDTIFEQNALNLAKNLRAYDIQKDNKFEKFEEIFVKEEPKSPISDCEEADQDTFNNVKRQIVDSKDFINNSYDTNAKTKEINIKKYENKRINLRNKLSAPNISESTENTVKNEEVKLKCTIGNEDCHKESAVNFSNKNLKEEDCVSISKHEDKKINLKSQSPKSEFSTLKLDLPTNNLVDNFCTTEKSKINITSNICGKPENKIIVKSKTDVTMEIVDSQNKTILLKKVILKKKAKKVKNKT